MAQDVAEKSSSIADLIHKLRDQVYKRYGRGALKALSDELDEPYVEVCKALGEANAERLRKVEELVAGDEA